jgi:hypothetical protein
VDGRYWPEQLASVARNPRITSFVVGTRRTSPDDSFHSGIFVGRDANARLTGGSLSGPTGTAILSGTFTYGALKFQHSRTLPRQNFLNSMLV